MMLVSEANDLPPLARRLLSGMYIVGHFGSSAFLRNYEPYPEDLSISPYGVCDNDAQIEFNCPELITSKRKFVVTLTPVEKAKQSSWGGWRWHKWGPYIGTQERSGCEYLYDEPNIDLVYVYHIYEKV